MELGLRIQKFEFGGGRGERAAKQIGEDPESRDFGKTKRDRRWQKTTRQAQNTVQAATVQLVARGNPGDCSRGVFSSRLARLANDSVAAPAIGHRHGLVEDSGYGLIMISRFRVSSLLPRKLEELGLSLPTVLRQANLPLGLFSKEKILVTTEELFALYRGIAEVSGDPAIGLKLGSEHRLERYSPVAIAALYTRSFRDAVQRMARYKQLTCPEEIRVVSQGDQCAVRFQWLLARESEPAVLIDVCFAWILAIGRRGTGGPLTPLRLELMRSPAHREILEEHSCNLHWN